MKTLLHTFASFLVATIASVQIFAVLESNSRADAEWTDSPALATRGTFSASAPSNASESRPSEIANENEDSTPAAFSGFPLQASPLVYGLFGMAALALTIVGRRAGEKGVEI